MAVTQSSNVCWNATFSAGHATWPQDGKQHFSQRERACPPVGCVRYSMHGIRAAYLLIRRQTFVCFVAVPSALLPLMTIVSVFPLSENVRTERNSLVVPSGAV